MKKFKAVFLRELELGDRFYFALDEKKRVWELTRMYQNYVLMELVGTGRTKQVSFNSSPDRQTVVFLSSEVERAQ